VNKDEFSDWIIENGKYLFTRKENSLKINFYQLEHKFYMIYFDPELNKITEATTITIEELKKYL
jgi:hypothetical protein